LAVSAQRGEVTSVIQAGIAMGGEKKKEASPGCWLLMGAESLKGRGRACLPLLRLGRFVGRGKEGDGASSATVDSPLEGLRERGGGGHRRGAADRSVSLSSKKKKRGKKSSLTSGSVSTVFVYDAREKGKKREGGRNLHATFSISRVHEKKKERKRELETEG